MAKRKNNQEEETKMEVVELNNTVEAVVEDSVKEAVGVKDVPVEEELVDTVDEQPKEVVKEAPKAKKGQPKKTAEPKKLVNHTYGYSWNGQEFVI